MKARRVKGLDPEGPLADQLQRIVEVRSAELAAFWPRVSDPAEVEALHDLRIAAKRLRYILEAADGLFGPYADKAVKEVKALQDLVGEIHDCDVMVPRVAALASRALAEDVVAVVERAAPGAHDLDPALAADAPQADAARGLHTLQVRLLARREVLFGRFLEVWRELGRQGFEARLAFAIAERPAVDPPPDAEEEAAAMLPPSQDRNGTDPDGALASGA